jgi:leucyl aminopeptidase
VRLPGIKLASAPVVQPHEIRLRTVTGGCRATSGNGFLFLAGGEAATAVCNLAAYTDMITAGAHAGHALASAQAGSILLEPTGLSETGRLCDFLEGMLLGWSPATLKTQPTVAAAANIRVLVQESRARDIEGELHRRRIGAEAVAFARHMIALPANRLRPDDFAPMLSDRFAGSSVAIDVLDTARLRDAGLNLITAVGDGSPQPARLIVLRSSAGTGQPLMLIGKGVTFDGGGFSAKIAEALEKTVMSRDMAGAAAVAGTIHAQSRLYPARNIVALLPVVENIAGPSALRPGDVLTGHGGLSVEVSNTDAEGRLLLADAISYARSEFRPSAIVDIATLVGPQANGLGTAYAPLFATDERLADMLVRSGDATDERVWRMPLDELYDRELASDIADLRNIGDRRGGNACIAAAFLRRFAGDASWAHIDIGAQPWPDKDTPLAPKTGHAFGVRLLNHFCNLFFA